jgi:integrase/recombinase XerD
MQSYLENFTQYLAEEKTLAENSILAYSRDINEFHIFLANKNINNPCDVTETEIIAFLFHLKSQGKSSSTVNRKLASLRVYYYFLGTHNNMLKDPTKGIKPPKIEKKKIEYLTVEEIEQLLSISDSSAKGLRDKALLEVLYASGMRVSEIAGTDLANINLRIGFITVNGEVGKARVIPLGRPARAALEAYIYEARPLMAKDKDKSKEALFLNYNGERLTRQGIWKVIKENAKVAGIEIKITPRALRNSFAIHMIQNGADLKTLQELLGHENMTATQIYLSFSKNRIKDVYDIAHPRA